ncbi:ArgS-related anticodon-binding protein NrtL [Streptomyces sp. 3213.3]|uniref:ArgS-related anticodon-binding protein NrtL n=1 Tax=Streptomyces sp. 3213.3 TaxID=1855348 RepID=UPI000B8695A4|nr:DALR anticodon-binding domain-containing protein [Streptomyces sp. 3213.3]
MTPVELSRTVLRAVRRAVDEGELSVVVPERASVTVPGAGGCGDYATNIALQLARPAGETPRRVAELLLPHLAGAQGVSGVEITGPGFLNISLGSTASTSLVAEILRRGPRYGFVDAPTTGAVTPSTSTTGAVTPSTSTTGAVTPSTSTTGAVTPSTSTTGADTPSAPTTGADTPSAPTAHLVRLHAPHEPRALVVMDVVARLLRSQGADVRTTCETGPPEPAWATVLGDAGVAGVDPQEPASLDLDLDLELGLDVEADVDIDVDVVRPVRVPTPDLAPLLTLGRDAARWALLHPAAHDRPRVTADHLVQREANPLFRVRYAYARTRAVSRNAADLGFTARPGDVRAEVTPLTPLLADHPRVLSRAAAHRAPDLLARHLVAVADATLVLLPAVLPLGDEKPLAAHRARLALAEAAGAVLAGGLSLLGIDAPEHL